MGISTIRLDQTFLERILALIRKLFCHKLFLDIDNDPHCVVLIYFEIFSKTCFNDYHESIYLISIFVKQFLEGFVVDT